MRKKDLINGMVIRSKTLKTEYVVSDANERLVFDVQSGIPDYITNEMLEDFEPVKDFEPATNEQQFVYVVTTQVVQGEEFSQDLYYGVFECEEKAIKYFNSEKRDWMERMARHYSKENDLVGVYTCNEHRVEIIGNEDHKNVVIIEMKQKQIQ